MAEHNEVQLALLLAATRALLKGWHGPLWFMSQAHQARRVFVVDHPLHSVSVYGLGMGAFGVENESLARYLSLDLNEPRVRDHVRAKLLEVLVPKYNTKNAGYVPAQDDLGSIFEPVSVGWRLVSAPMDRVVALFYFEASLGTAAYGFTEALLIHVPSLEGITDHRIALGLVAVAVLEANAG